MGKQILNSRTIFLFNLASQKSQTIYPKLLYSVGLIHAAAYIYKIQYLHSKGLNTLQND